MGLSGKVTKTLFTVQILILIIYVAATYFFISPWVTRQIVDLLKISNTSDLFPIWKNPPVQPILHIYLFNYTNTNLWLDGNTSLAVDEIGPYVFKETWTKSSIVFHPDDTVSYDLNKTYHFMSELSSGRPDKDVVILPNIPLFSAGYVMEDADSISLSGFRAAVSSVAGVNLPLFVQRNVSDVLWGYDDPLTEMGQMMMPKEEVEKAKGRFGLFVGKNGTSVGRYRVGTGVQDEDRVSQVTHFNGEANFEAWKSDECNRVKGSEGSLFPPGVSVNDQLSVLVPDLCRSLEFTFEEYTLLEDVSALRMRPHDDMWKYGGNKTLNSCFCSISEDTDEEMDDFFTFDDDDFGDDHSLTTCPPDGVFDVSKCKFGAPMAVSWPHLLDSDPANVKVEGLSPNSSLHMPYMDIRPDLGLPLAAHIRMQINIKMSKSPAFKEFKKLPEELAKEPMYAPIMWFDDVIEKPTEELMVLLRDALRVGPNLVLGTFMFVFILVSVEILLILLYRKWRNRFEFDFSRCHLEIRARETTSIQ